MSVSHTDARALEEFSREKWRQFLRRKVSKSCSSAVQKEPLSLPSHNLRSEHLFTGQMNPIVNMTSPDTSDPKRHSTHISVLRMCLLISTTVLFFNANLLKIYRPTTAAAHHSMTCANFSSLASLSLAVQTPNKQNAKPKGPRPKLDFLIAGFSKCGTTTLVHAFAAHNETDISLRERCAIGGANLADGSAYAKLTEVVWELSPDPKVKRGVKCPISLRSHRTLSLLTRHSPETKLIFGVRHPVHFFESHYNYRITELYDKNLKAPIPPIETLTGGNEWRGVTTRNARFDVFLLQLGKTNMTTMELEELKSVPQMAVVPNSFQVFLYSLEQMEDANITRKENFQHELESFLDLKHPMNIGHENLNNFVGQNAHKETIDICDSKYEELRNELVSQGRESQLWLRDKFLKSPDVTVANRDHFLQTLQAWESDPCAARKVPTKNLLASLEDMALS